MGNGIVTSLPENPRLVQATDHVPRPQAFFVGGPDHPSITEVPHQRAETDNAGQCKRHDMSKYKFKTASTLGWEL